MKKKILCLALCALMIVASFVGCAEKSRDELMNQIGEETSKGAVTLNMYVLAESPVSAEQELLIENAVNDIVDSYKIKLDLMYFTEDTYYTTLEKNLAEMKRYYDNKENLSKETEAPVYTDENGLPTTYYPPNEEFQVDLFYFSGYDRYKKYNDAGYLADFTAELTNNASLLKGGISSILYENVKTVNGKYNMMPVNAEVGEYTYMLVNKEILSSMQFTADEITSPVSAKCAELLDLVKTYRTDFDPFYSSEGKLALDDVKFFGTDSNGFASDEFSVIAGTYDSSWNYGEENAYPAMGGINDTANSGAGNVKDQIRILKNYDFNGYYAAEDSTKPFAVGYVKGGLEVVEKYGDDYEVVVIDTPTLTTEALYDNVMAISAKTKSLPSSSRILAELYTNEELINILANGIEGENYIWTKADGEDGQSRVIEKQAKDDRYIYNIDPYKMANVAAIYPTVDDDPARSERILDQNSDAKKDLLLGYTLYSSGLKLDAMTKVAEYSKTAYDKIMAAKDNAELDAVFAEIDTIIASDEVQSVVGGEIAAYYMKWLTDKKIYVASAA